MRTERGPGNDFDYTNATGATIASGTPVQDGGLIGIAVADIANLAVGCCKMVGEHELRKDNSTFARGGSVYWDADGSPLVGTALSGCCTSTATGNIFLGKATKAAATGVSTVNVKLLPQLAGGDVFAAEGTYGPMLTGVDQATCVGSSIQRYNAGILRVDAVGDRYRYGYGIGQHHCGFGSWADNKVTISHLAPAQTQTLLGAIGDTEVKVTLDANDGFAADGTVALNELAGGSIVMGNQPGAELLLMNRRIVGNTAVTGGGTITITLDMPLSVAVTVGVTYIEVMGNPDRYLRGGLTTNATKASFRGVPMAALLNQWGWFKTKCRPGMWICPNSDPGLNAGDREAYFQANGSVIGGEDAVVESGLQWAGFIVENSADGAGPPFVALQLE